MSKFIKLLCCICKEFDKVFIKLIFWNLNYLVRVVNMLLERLLRFSNVGVIKVFVGFSNIGVFGNIIVYVF